VRAAASFFGILASITTMGAAIVRLWWSKPRPLTKHGEPYEIDGEPIVQDPKAPSWLATAAKWWLIIVVGGLTIGFLIWAVYTVIDLST
jgi:hypothetical protein